MIELAPELDELRTLLKPHASHVFGANDRGCPAEETLGVWTDRLIEYGSPKPDGDRHELTGGCGIANELMAVPPPTADDKAMYWYCSIRGFSSDPAGESPWNCGLTVRVHKIDRSIDLASLGCPGTC